MTMKRYIFGLTAAALMSFTAAAQGGNDPIEGIDIIMKEDPSQAPAYEFSASQSELEMVNKLTGPARSQYTSKVFGEKIRNHFPESKGKVDWNTFLFESVVDFRMNDKNGEAQEQSVAEKSISTPDGKTTYSMNYKLTWGEVAAGQDVKNLSNAGLIAAGVGAVAIGALLLDSAEMEELLIPVSP